MVPSGVWLIPGYCANIDKIDKEWHLWYFDKNEVKLETLPNKEIDSGSFLCKCHINTGENIFLWKKEEP
jgi:hypothetical protein